MTWRAVPLSLSIPLVQRFQFPFNFHQSKWIQRGRGGGGGCVPDDGHGELDATAAAVQHGPPIACHIAREDPDVAAGPNHQKQPHKNTRVATRRMGMLSVGPLGFVGGLASSSAVACRAFGRPMVLRDLASLTVCRRGKVLGRGGGGTQRRTPIRTWSD